MNKFRERILIITGIAMIFTTIGCDLTNDNKGQTYSLEKENGEYISEVEYDPNFLDIEKLNEYNIDIEFDPSQKMYKGKQSVRYVNNEDALLNEIYFHIYPNAFKEENTTPYSLDSYVEGFDEGFISITSVMVEGKSVEYSILGDDNTLLKIPIESLLPGETIDMYMEYEVSLPYVSERFGYGDQTFQIGNGYPVVAVYDDNGWDTSTYYPIGDPFYSDVSNYRVTIKAPKEYIVACSGNIISEEVLGEHKIWNVEAVLMRDFAWAASPHFIIEEKVVDGVLVRNYLLPNNESINKASAELAYESFEIYNRIFGKYPYEVLSIVTADATGMEYPGLVFVWQNISTGNKSFESTLTHEIAHQWWYGLVGNNQIEEAWLDESFAIYAEKLFYDEAYGEEQGQKRYENIVANYENRHGDRGKEDLILTPIYNIEDWNEYSGLLLKGAMFLNEVENDLGKEEFYNVLNSYYNKHKFSIATTKDFIEICEEISGKNYEKEMNKWFLKGE